MVIVYNSFIKLPHCHRFMYVMKHLQISKHNRQWCMFACMYACMYVWTYVWTNVCMNAYMCLCIYVGMYACIYVHIYVGMYVCMCVCICFRMYVIIYVHKRWHYNIYTVERFNEEHNHFICYTCIINILYLTSSRHY